MLVPKLRFKREDGTSYSKWKNEYLNKCATFHSGLTYSPNDVTNGNSGVLVIRSTNIQNGILVYNDNVYVNVELPEKLKLQLNDTVMCVRNGSKALVGKNALVKHCDLDKTWGAFMTVIRGNESNCFIHHYLNSPYFKRQMDINAGTSTINQITSAMLNECILSIPTDTEEQQKIADFLSTVDEVIAQSEAEVQNLEQQKKGAMQKIFSQEVRFKREDGTEFPEWEEKTFEETFIPLNNNTFSRDMLNNESGTVQNIHYGDILVKYGAICDVKKISLPFVNTDIATKKYDIMKNGDIIIADTAEDATVGKAIELIGIDNDIIISGLHTMACRPKQKYAPKFLGYLINSPAYHNQLFPYMQGIKVTSVGRKNIANTKLYYPCLEEQQKIADFLSAYDEAITYAKQELEKWKELKKGLLQQMFV